MPARFEKSGYPERVAGSPGAPGPYARVPDCYAVPAGGKAPKEGVLLKLGHGATAVVRSEQPPADPRAVCVYKTPDGGLVVPTGRVFVRFAEGDSAARHEGAIKAAGYRVEQVPGYAPNAAWVVASDGEVGTALSRVGSLVTIPGVERVEPQMEGERSTRG